MARYDFIIVGSGTSGGVIAYFLTKAGYKCLLVEAGKYFTAQTFPDNEMDGSAQLFWNGGLDVSADGKMVFLRGKCVGGGSVINQCLLDRFDEFVFSEWRNVTGLDFFCEKEMEPHYEAIERKIVLQKIPKEHWNQNANLCVAGFEKLGLKWAPLRRGQSDCPIEEGNDCIVCLNGCPRNSKQSVLVAFLPEAIDNGLELWSEFLVEKIEHNNDEVTVFGRGDGKLTEVKASRCFLAGGSLGTTHLLLRSGFKEKVPQLGEGFFCHPQIMNFGVFDEPINSHKGAFQAIKSDDMNMREKGFKLENVFAGPIAIAMLHPSFGKKHQEWMKKYTCLACIEVAVKDHSRGQLSLNKRGNLVIGKKLDKEDWKRAYAGIKTVRQIFETVEAKEIFSSPFIFGLHLMGGCAIGKDHKSSVVNENFQMHGFPNIYIADSSIFPTAPGLNPALTIMALSHKACQQLCGC